MTFTLSPFHSFTFSLFHLFAFSPFYLFTFLLFHNNLPRRSVGEANDVDTLLRFANHAPLDVVACNFCHFLRCHHILNAVGVEARLECLRLAVEGLTLRGRHEGHVTVLRIIVEAFQRCRHHIARSQYLCCIGRYANILFITLSTLSAH